MGEILWNATTGGNRKEQPRLCLCARGALRQTARVQMTHAQAKSRHAQLAGAIRRHDHAYYVEARPAVSDREYDLLYAELLALEKEFPDLVTQNSPSQRVGGGLTESFKRITHEQPMLSLEKIQASDSPTKDEEPDRERRNRLQDERTIEEFRAFDATIRKQLGKERVSYILEPKVDGVSLSAHYRAGKLALGATRGDGREGTTSPRTSAPSAPCRSSSTRRSRPDISKCAARLTWRRRSSTR